MKTYQLLIVVGLASVLFACKREEVTYGVDAGVIVLDPIPTPAGNGICFERDVLPIFVSNCTQSGCHNSQDRKDGYDLTSYSKIISRGLKAGDAEDSEIYEVLTESGDDAMPQAPYQRLSNAQIAIIGQWIDQGAKNTSCADTTCDTTQFTYSQGVKPLLQTYCVGCHNSGTYGVTGLSTHADVAASASNGSLLGSITHNSNYVAMPRNSKKLSDCQITTIRRWIEAGAPNN